MPEFNPRDTLNLRKALIGEGNLTAEEKVRNARYQLAQNMADKAKSGLIRMKK